MAIIFPALFIMFLLLAGVGVIAPAGFHLVETTAESVIRQSYASSNADGTSLTVITSEPISPYYEATLHNNGRVSTRDFPRWTVIARYHGTDGDLHIQQLQYVPSGPLSTGQWTVQGIYLDAQSGVPEAYHPGILDPGEDVVIRMLLDPPADDFAINNLTVTTPNGVSIVSDWRFWKAMASTPGGIGNGGALASDGTLLYALQGGGSRAFWSYNPTTDTWATESQTSGPIGEGAALVHAVASNGNEYIYALHGGGAATFRRFSLANGNWQGRAAAPSGVSWGGALAWDGADTIYALGGNTTLGLLLDFWEYSISQNTWTPAPNTPAAVQAGAALAYLNETVFAMRGSNTSVFWGYSGGLTWESQVDTPTSTGAGGALAARANHLYALAGNGTGLFWRYSPNQDRWQGLPNTPASVGGGAGLAVLNGNIYALRGDGTTDFWRY